jgi:hypothetical protein
MSKEYVQKHYQRKHPTVNFALDFKPPVNKSGQQPQQKVMSTAELARENKLA